MPLPVAFPVIRPTARPEKFDEAVRRLREAAEAGGIRKADLDAIRGTLGRAAEEAWKRTVQEPYFWMGKWESQPQPIRDLYNDIMISSLHDCLSARRKIDRAGLDGPVIAAMDAVLAEAMPLAEAVRDLKGHVVKGRAPNPNPPRDNPDKETGTCSCCFRGIAVVPSGHMAHHGYQRPGTGEQTPSCAGIRFRPLEVSVEGLEWLVGAVDKRRSDTEGRLARADELTEISWLERDRTKGAGPYAQVRKTCRKGEEGWDGVLRLHVEQLGRMVRSLGSELEFLTSELARWRGIHGIGEPEGNEEAGREADLPSP